METKALDRQPTSSLLIWAVWLGVILLAMIGVASAIGRAVFLDDFAARIEPGRQAFMESLHRDDPHAAERAADVAWLDGRFAAHPFMTVLHLLPGGIFLLLAPLQFSTRLRRRHIRIHRWSGRLVIVTGIIGAVTGLYFGILMPYGGWGEAVAIAIFGGLFLTAAGQGYVAIRRHQVARHREWMIRVLALALAISVVRILMGVLDYALTPAGFTPRQNFVLAVWAAWIISLAAAELWIRHTRPVVGFRGTTLASTATVATDQRLRQGDVT
jgi:uncharacterized membrane protein